MKLTKAKLKKPPAETIAARAAAAERSAIQRHLEKMRKLMWEDCVGPNKEEGREDLDEFFYDTAAGVLEDVSDYLDERALRAKKRNKG